MAAMSAVTLTLGAVACGSSDSGGGSAASAADVAAGKSAAETAIADYIGQPSAFPVDEPLKALPTGAQVDFVDCGTPYCGLIFTLLEPAAQAMGVELKRVIAGSAAAEVASAFDTVLADEPDAVIVSATNVELWKSQLEQLVAQDIPVVTSGVTGAEQYGVVAPQGAEAWSELAGGLMADYITAELATDSEVVVYRVPELPFTATMNDALAAELDEVCPDCSVRTVDIPAATLYSTGPSTIVRDLQAHASTTVAVFTTDDMATGLPAALSAAGIDVQTVGNAPSPAGLQDLKDGKRTVQLGYDTAVTSWSLMDQVARLLAGQELTGPQAEAVPVLQFLRPEDITFDPAQGWTGYPDFAQRFLSLWGVQ
jgi:ribose transport system substrate-binding protein